MNELITVVALATAVYVVTASCPRQCRCLHGNEVECSSSGLIRVPVGIPDDTERLSLDGNNIPVVYAEDFRLLTNLKILTLSNSHLGDIEDGSFEALRKLQELNLNMNVLRIIRPSILQGLESLKILRIDQNQALRMAPCTLSSIPSIESINADITRIHFNDSLFLNSSCGGSPLNETSAISDDCFVPLPSLKHLRLERADASQINYRVMSLMPNLVSLNLQNTAIQSIGDRTFRRNRFLTTLFLAENLLRHVGNATFVGLKRLQVLVLTSNHGLQIHPNTFLATRKLKTLYLDKIGLTDLSINFISFQQLTNLILSENELMYISPGTLSGVGSIRICLGNNPWHCDCNLVWLYEWLKQFSLGNLLDCQPPICRTPARLAGSPLLSLSRDAFQCINETITEGPDRETGTPFYPRFVPWHFNNVSRQTTEGGDIWVPFTYQTNPSQNVKYSSESTNSDSPVTRGARTFVEKTPTTPYRIDTTLEKETKESDLPNKSNRTKGIEASGDGPINITQSPMKTVTYEIPNLRPATGYHEVGSNSPDDGISVIILCTEVGVTCLIMLGILWLVFAIRRANQRKRDRLRGFSEYGSALQTVSPLRYFQER